jgi:hypothetical protein
VPTSKGQWLITVHMGTEKVLITGTLLIFKLDQKTGDYHKEINSHNYMQQMKENHFQIYHKTVFL